ncbi:GH-E family nuclease [Pedobacter sp. SYSU D00535]|uniref:GH-E family nuclease n=1 Tax=Pedobacter sp. SYSU D00535 TaxID=2810308 RepID=UPI001A95BABB|nr:GH-E family nuclease [Pedobacter sp. SYSU D00535]
MKRFILIILTFLYATYGRGQEAQITASGPTTFCEGGSVVLTASQGSSYLWNNGATGQSITVNRSGNYAVTVSGTGWTSSASIRVTVNPIPLGEVTVIRDNAMLVWEFTFDKEGNIYVIDGTNDRVVKWRPNEATGVIVAGGHGRGNGLHQLHQPQSAVVDNAGNIFIVDHGNDRIVKWTPNTSSGQIVVQGAPNSPLFANPKGITIDASGNLYVADVNNHRIAKINPTMGTVVTVAGGNGQGYWPNQLFNPADVELDSKGNLYILDVGNYRIQKWVPGELTGTTVAGGNGQGSALNQFGLTFGFDLDENDNIYIQDAYRTLKWIPGAPEAQLVYKSGANNAYHVALDNEQNIFIEQRFNALRKLVNEPIIRAEGPTELCAGKSVTLSAPYRGQNNGPYTYKWSNEKEGSVIVVNVPGKYTCTVINEYGCSVISNEIEVTTIQKPLITGPEVICPGETITLSAPPGYTYFWSNGKTEQSIPVNSVGDYSVTVTNALGCSLTSDTKRVTDVPLLLSPTITLTGSLCTNNLSLITNNNSDFSRWFKDGVEIGKGGAISVSSPGVYTVKVVNPCGPQLTSEPVTIHPPIVPAPLITANGTFPICAGTSVKITADASEEEALTIHWFRNGKKYASGKNFIDVKLPGEYTAKRTTECGSSNFSNQLNVTVDYKLRAKKSHFDDIDKTVPEYDYDATDTQQKEEMLAEIEDACEGQADVWMRNLASAGLSSIQQTELRAKLVAICKAGGDFEHGMGSSTLPPGATGPIPSSFADAIRQYAPNGVFTAQLNPWLLDSPYPYDKQPSLSGKEIGSSSAEICTRLQELKQACGNPASTTEFYNCLSQKYEEALNITEEEFADLLKSCDRCNYILNASMPLPAFLDPYSKGCITKAEFNQAVSELTGQVPGLTTADVNYEQIFANYLNHKWGFSIAFHVYQDYAALPDNTSKLLCNQPAFPGVFDDDYADFKKEIELAVGNGRQDYSKYIPEIRKKAMLEYTNVCSSAKPYVNLTETTKTYHYTLYYYDQADNLVRTVPPEGVSFLNSDQIKMAERYREKDLAVCAYNGPTSNSTLSLAQQSLNTIISSSATNNTDAAIELWMYDQNATGAQTIITAEKQYMVQVCLGNGKINADIYTMQPDGVEGVIISRSNHISGSIGTQTLFNWHHVVVRGKDLASGELELWLNGRKVDGTSTTGETGCGWEISTSPLVLPQFIGNLKHLRVYNRRLGDQEIINNAESACFNAKSIEQLAWHRFNIPDEILAGGSTSTLEQRFEPVYPDHTLATTYAYNSTNQVVQQVTPDGGTSRFWYDDLSRLVVSQNEKQRKDTDNGKALYSYTKYDDLGRITEVGERRMLTTGFEDPSFVSKDKYLAFLNDAAGSNQQITQTIYDNAPGAENGPGLHTALAQNNLRKRVAASVYRDTPESADINATYYDYDLNGNVKSLWQQVNGLGLKKIDYEYDLVSGKVNKVFYQKGQDDRFYYQYKYDAENRLTEVWNGVDPANPKQVASYQYYYHGPLARTELGGLQDKVQGLDYAYTLQGWLKGVNSYALNPSADIGADGNFMPKDVMAYSLGYYNADYKPIGGTTSKAFAISYQAGTNELGRNLYNGNISNTTVALSKFRNGDPVGYSYRYDQLNRLKQMRQTGFAASASSWTTDAANEAYRENITYDGNGNILSFLRYGSGDGKPVAMDNLNYAYSRDAAGRLQNNRLRHVTDNVSAGSYAEDIDNQSPDNYSYDDIGNLVKDTEGGIDKIDWTVYGKIRSIKKTDGTVIAYSYDPSGNRVSKTLGGQTSYYVRDAQGNNLGLYEKSGSQLFWREQVLYGSSRVGMFRPDLDLNGEQKATAWSLWDNHANLQQYELTNHLGNVMSVISGRRFGSLGNYTADVVSQQDYYPFGMIQPGRSFSSGGYRYGFNGKENDNEVKGEGNQQDYGMRIYDPRLGRFLSEDPLTRKYSFLTPYQFASNSPIMGIDEDGGELKYYNIDWVTRNGKSQLSIANQIKTDNVALGVVLRLSNGLFSQDIKLGDLNYSTLGLSAFVVGYNGQWKVLPSSIDPTNLPNLNDPIWETFESPSDYKSRIYNNAQNLIEGVSALSDLRDVYKTLKNPVNKSKLNANEVNSILANKYSKNRPKYGKNQVEEVWEAAKDADGKVYDPNTGRELFWDKSKKRNGQWDMGHKPKYKYKDELERLRRGEITEEQFLKNYKESKNYRPEGVSENRSRKYDKKK